MNANRFEYQLARDQQIQRLRAKCEQFYQENITLKKSLEELIKVNTQLTESIEDFNNANIGPQLADQNSGRNQSQNAEDMQNKIDMLTMELQMLRTDIRGPQQRKSQNNVEPDNESLMNMIEELIESFKSVQQKYEKEIGELKEEVRNYQHQWASVLGGIENKSAEKFKSLDSIIEELKKKDDLVQLLEKKLQTLESMSEFPQNQKEQLSYRADSRQIQEIKSVFESQLEQKNRTINIYKDLVGKLRAKLTERI